MSNIPEQPERVPTEKDPLINPADTSLYPRQHTLTEYLGSQSSAKTPSENEDFTRLSDKTRMAFIRKVR